MSGQLKPWQIGLFVVTGIAVVFAAIWAMGGASGPDLSKRVILVDIVSGELFEVSTAKKAAVIPVRNPETGERTLFPAVKGDDGTWRLSEKFRERVAGARNRPAVTNPTTGELKLKNDSPKSLSL
jgi:hypothetical protein